MVKILTGQEAKDEITKGSVVIDFFAEWCGPCKMVGPMFDEAAKELEGKVTFIKINVDNDPEIAGQFGVKSIPAFVALKDGAVVDNKIGFMPKPAIIDFANKTI